MYIKNTIFPHCKIIDELSICQIEFQCLSVLVTLPAAVPFIVSTLYRSPSYPVSLLMPFLENSLNKIAHLNKPCFWGGDFNVNLFNYCESNDTMSFLDCMNSYGFFPTITVPTRVCVTPPFTATLIDNIFTNVLETVSFNGVICAGIADHQAVCCTSDLVWQHSNPVKRTVPKPKFNYNRIEELKANVLNCLDGFLEIDDPDVCARRLITVIQTKVSELSVIGSSRHTTPIQPWVTPGLLRSINFRNKLLKEFLRNRCKEKLKKFKKYRNVLRVAIRRAKQSYYHSQFAKNAGNPKRLWADLLDVIKKKTVMNYQASLSLTIRLFIHPRLLHSTSMNIMVRLLVHWIQLLVPALLTPCLI